MKVLLINNLGRLHSGAEVMTAQLKRSLIDSGHEAKILSGNEDVTGERISDLEFKSFTDTSRLKGLLYLVNPSAIRQFRQALSDFRPDIVHLHNISKASPLLLRELANIPTVLTIHDHLAFDPTRLADIPTLAKFDEELSGYFTGTFSLRYIWEKLRFGLYRRYRRNINLTITCSDFYHRAAAESKLYDNLRTIHNGIILPPVAAYPEGAPGVNLLYAGRLDHIKGVDVLLNAFATARMSYSHLQLTICGTGEQADYLQTLAGTLGISGSVHFKNFVNQQEFSKIYAQTHLVVVPSRYPDNLPTVCIEAMARGRAVIASNIGGIPEMVFPGRTGLLVTPGDVTALTSAILTLALDPKLMRAMGRHGRQVAEAEFSSNPYIQATLRAYTSIL